MRAINLLPKDDARRRSGKQKKQWIVAIPVVVGAAADRRARGGLPQRERQGQVQAGRADRAQGRARRDPDSRRLQGPEPERPRGREADARDRPQRRALAPRGVGPGPPRALARPSERRLADDGLGEGARLLVGGGRARGARGRHRGRDRADARRLHVLARGGGPTAEPACRHPRHRKRPAPAEPAGQGRHPAGRALHDRGRRPQPGSRAREAPDPAVRRDRADRGRVRARRGRRLLPRDRPAALEGGRHRQADRRHERRHHLGPRVDPPGQAGIADPDRRRLPPDQGHARPDRHGRASCSS